MLVGVDLEQQAPVGRAGFQRLDAGLIDRLIAPEIDAVGDELSLRRHLALHLAGVAKELMQGSGVPIFLLFALAAEFIQ